MRRCAHTRIWIAAVAPTAIRHKDPADFLVRVHTVLLTTRFSSSGWFYQVGEIQPPEVISAVLPAEFCGGQSNSSSLQKYTYQNLRSSVHQLSTLIIESRVGFACSKQTYSEILLQCNPAVVQA